jgi:hypothetical protein
MDFIEGQTAKQLKEAGRMTPRLALSIIQGVAEALHHAHLNGVVHRDVKPANIMVDRFERAQLMDFGLARRVDEDLSITRTGTTMGTPAYMAPEQAEGRLADVDGQSDVYSAGACLYEFLTGMQPFDGPTLMAVLRNVIDTYPISPRRLNPRIHKDAEVICLKCLEKEKANRYLTAQHLAEDIRRFNAGEAIMAKPEGFFASLLKRARRHKEIATAGVIAVLALAAALAYAALHSHQLAQKEIEAKTMKLHGYLESAGKASEAALKRLSGFETIEAAVKEEETLQIRKLLAEAYMGYNDALQLDPGESAAKQGLEAWQKLRDKLEVKNFIFDAKLFLRPAQDSKGLPAQPNYAAAEYVARLALKREPENAEARQLLNEAVGIRAVTIETVGAQAEVFARRSMDVSLRPLPAEKEESLGAAPVRGKELEPGLYLLSFKRPGMENQEATLLVTREAKEEDLALKIVINASERNMVLMPAGAVSVPQKAPQKISAFAIDRFAYPNKAGEMPRTKVTFLEAQKLCRDEGKELCTALQWVRACMGDERRRFPYGKNYSSGACATGFDLDARPQPFPSGAFARCRTPEGIYDMSGNVAEWAGGEQQNVYGGDWTSSTKFADITVSCRANMQKEETDLSRIGFRCCKNK